VCGEEAPRTTGTSATRISRRGTMPRPSSTTGSTWRLQRRWATGRGRAMRARTLGARISRGGTSATPSSTTRSTWRLQRRWATGRGRAGLDAGQEDAALAHLKEHLSWRVQRGRDTCAGCGQTRGEHTPMLTCSGCRVARFCSADHQKMASKKAALGGSLTTGRHKDICGVLRKWRDVVKNSVSPDSCTAELVAFLQRENARCPRTQRERQRQFSHNRGPGRRPAERGRESDLE
jgi:hypothetical protein